VIRFDSLKRLELALAILLSATALFLLAVRATHAGALWRDECAVVNLARMPSVTDIGRNFQHEAFPVPFQLLVRAYSDSFGSSDSALRAFGIAAGVAVLCALWISAKLIGKDPPLLSLALLGLNTTFLFWGTTVRGYGFGSTFIVLAVGLIASLILTPSQPRAFAAVFVSVAAVQCLVHNLALVLAMTGSAIVVCLTRRNLRRSVIFLGILALCLISFVPYLNAYSTESGWSRVVEFPVTFRLLWNQFNFALGNPSPPMALLWHIPLAGLLAVSVWRLTRLRANKPPPEWDLLLFGSLALIAALVLYYEFLHLLSYLARSWYYLALLSTLAVLLDGLCIALRDVSWIRIGRLVCAAIALVVLPINAWSTIVQRQTNIDIAATKLTELAKRDDLIVVAPWQYGITFTRYYHGDTPWITLPTMSDLRVHRYDLMFEKMMAEHPIDDVLDAIKRTLERGSRVWFVGGIRPPPTGMNPLELPPAPANAFGRDNVAYSRAWMEQMSVFVRAHSGRGQTIHAAGSNEPVNQYEDVPLVVVDGWQ
jgi:hypothetical protein